MEGRAATSPPRTPQPRHQARQPKVSLDPPPPLHRIGDRRGRPMQRHFHVPPCGGSAYLTGKAEPCLPDHVGRAQRADQRWRQAQAVHREEIRKGVAQRPSAPSGALVLKLAGKLLQLLQSCRHSACMGVSDSVANNIGRDGHAFVSFRPVAWLRGVKPSSATPMATRTAFGPTSTRSK